MPGDRGKALQSLIGFVQRDLHERTRVLVVDARHATGLSTALQAVASHVPDPRSVLVIDDAQRALAASQPWLSTAGHQRVLLGVDTDDARDLGVDVSGEVEKLVAQKVIDAQKTELPAVPDEVLCNQIAQLWPSTPGVVATALAHHLNGRIALLAQAVELDAIQQRVRNGRLCMVPDQISQLDLEPATLLEERWRSLAGTSRRMALIVCAIAPIHVDDLLKVLDRVGIEPSAWHDVATLPGWIDVRDDIALPGKDVAALAERLGDRSASVALEVRELLTRIAPRARTPKDTPPSRPSAPPLDRFQDTPRDRQAPAAATPPPRTRPNPTLATTAPSRARPAAKSHTPRPPRPTSTKPQTPRPAKSTPPTSPDTGSTSPKQRVRASYLIGQELAWLAPESARGERANALRNELHSAYRREGKLEAMVQGQRVAIDNHVARFGAKHPKVARARLVLAEMLAELDSPGAASNFLAAIAALKAACGADSEEVHDARQRRKRALNKP